MIELIGGNKMEIFYLIVLFTGPGILVKEISRYFSVLDMDDPPKNTIYENLFLIVVESALLNVITIILFNCGNSDKILRVEEFISELNVINFLGKYILVLFCLTIVYVFIKKFFGKIVHKIKSWWLDKKYDLNYGSSNEGTVWQNMMYYENTGKDYKVVSIYHNGEYVVSGMLLGYNSKKRDGKEFRLIRTYEVEKVLERDKKVALEKQWLGYIEKVYYDSGTGLMIKFYRNDELMEHWDEISKLS